jgi:hypothetical protein
VIGALSLNELQSRPAVARSDAVTEHDLRTGLLCRLELRRIGGDAGTGQHEAASGGGVGKRGTPCERMHAEYFSALSSPCLVAGACLPPPGMRCWQALSAGARWTPGVRALAIPPIRARRGRPGLAPSPVALLLRGAKCMAN